MDSRDMESILNPNRDTLLGAQKARSLENLIKWELVQKADYARTLSPGLRVATHAESVRIVADALPQEGESLRESRFIELALHAHREFANYLERCFWACTTSDEQMLSVYRVRHQLVADRIRAMESGNADDAMLEGVKFTLERVFSKVLAGYFVASASDSIALFDTEEYRPFVQETLRLKPGLKPSFHASEPQSAIRPLVAALARKAVPDLWAPDFFKLFIRLRDRDEFIRLRQTLRRIEGAFGALVVEREQQVANKIADDINSLQHEYERLVEAASTALSVRMRWRAMEMLAGTIAPYVSPWFDDMKTAHRRTAEEKAGASLEQEGGLRSDLFFASMVWNRPQEGAGGLPTTDKVAGPEVKIWGQGDLHLPWYEVE